MTDQKTTNPRRRLQELQAIPERLRTEEQWDEINELEITLAPVNRGEGTEQGQGARRGPPGPAKAPRPSGDGQARKPFKKFHKKPPPKDKAP
ncbi:MAG: hypothetical protein KGZ83_06490 [Sulfuricella sp.]|nr:hypothetical protein [Sulfuricella sp.]